MSQQFREATTADKVATFFANEIKCKNVLAETPSANLRPLGVLDLALLKSVTKAGNEVDAYGEPTDVMITNAAVFPVTYKTTEDGFDENFSSNHIGSFLFTNLILPSILKSNYSRIVNFSSDGHRASPINFDDQTFDNGKNFDPLHAYGHSKSDKCSLHLMIGKVLQRLRPTALAVHPGAIQTNLARDASVDREKFLQMRDYNGNQLLPEDFLLKSVAQDASAHITDLTTGSAARDLVKVLTSLTSKTLQPLDVRRSYIRSSDVLFGGGGWTLEYGRTVAMVPLRHCDIKHIFTRVYISLPYYLAVFAHGDIVMVDGVWGGHIF